MKLALKWTRHVIHPKFEFRIAREGRIAYEVFILQLTDGEHIGYGEAAPSRRYQDTPKQVRELLEQHHHELEQLPLEAAEDRMTRLEELLPSSFALQAAVDMAYWDLYARRKGIPLWRLWGGSRAVTLSSYTIGISDLEELPEKLQEASAYPILKIKLGTDHDREIVQTIRKHTNRLLRVDVNEGWRSLRPAMEMLTWLAEQGVEFVEQPFPAAELGLTAELKEFSPLPLVADENVVRPENVGGLKDAFHGINIKLMKCGGPTNALKMISLARKYGLEVMLGCMVETSVGISMMAQLAGLARWLDLDGNMLLADDPFVGVLNHKGRLILTNAPGTGVRPRTGVHWA